MRFMPEPSPTLLEWQSTDSLEHNRGPRWYLAGGVIVLMFAAYGLFQGSWTTALLAVLIGGMYFLLRNEKPQSFRVRISGLGIAAGQDFLPWNTLRDFWILVGRDHQELHLVRQSMIGKETVLYIHNIDPALVRSTLLQFLPERSGMEERALDTVARILKL
jgi:hypothetical protein